MRTPPRTTLVALAILATVLPAGLARAQSCLTTALPYSLSNGQAADASQVTWDLKCAAIYGLANTSVNIGIGTASPAFLLDVGGTTRVWGQLELSGGPNTSWPSLGFNAVYNGNSNGGFTNTFTGYSGFIQTTQDNGRIAFILAAGLQNAGAGFGMTERMSILENGNVGIGAASPTATLYVNGSTVLTQGYTTSSDARLKTDVTPITGALATVERLEGVHYRWLPAGERPVGKALNLPVDEPQIGFLAQAVQKVVPEAVTAPKAADDIYTLDPSKLIPILVEAIKEQQAANRADRTRIAELEAKVAKLEAAK